MLFIQMIDEGGLPNLPSGHVSSSPASFSSTLDVSIGSAPGSYPFNRIMIRVVGGKERQDATGYTWKDVSPSTRDFYWQKFRDDDSQEIPINVNRLYLDIMGEKKK
ncbi:hypothetical protein GH714_012379 [Hevea brasiliensis]|uniref:Uncharacterized protein n=1 Tax=Hevea brasiliensis TaxID=3981 RepID=A0A6A6K836_HEVBR|nr:hypothetical protein GH714_012379 [Hevea brasiliensis]